MLLTKHLCDSGFSVKLRGQVGKPAPCVVCKADHAPATKPSYLHIARDLQIGWFFCATARKRCCIPRGQAMAMAAQNETAAAAGGGATVAAATATAALASQQPARCVPVKTLEYVLDFISNGTITTSFLWRKLVHAAKNACPAADHKSVLAVLNVWSEKNGIDAQYNLETLETQFYDAQSANEFRDAGLCTLVQLVGEECNQGKLDCEKLRHVMRKLGVDKTLDKEKRRAILDNLPHAAVACHGGVCDAAATQHNVALFKTLVAFNECATATLLT